MPIAKVSARRLQVCPIGHHRRAVLGSAIVAPFVFRRHTPLSL